LFADGCSFGSWPNSRRASRWAQEIAALIELDPNLFEPHLIMVRQLRLPVKVLLLVHKAFDLPQD
jgi:hypothetical protein